MNENKKPKLFEIEHPATDYILEWWENLEHNKGDRAEIKRCKSLADMKKKSSFRRFYFGLKDKLDENFSEEQAAIIAGLASYIKYEKNKHKAEEDKLFAYQMARKKGKESKKPKLSELRFRRLLEIKDREKLYRFLIQVIRLLEEVNLLNILSIAYFWGDKTKVKLSYAYYDWLINHTEKEFKPSTEENTND